MNDFEHAIALLRKSYRHKFRSNQEAKLNFKVQQRQNLIKPFQSNKTTIVCQTTAKWKAVLQTKCCPESKK